MKSDLIWVLQSTVKIKNYITWIFVSACVDTSAPKSMKLTIKGK